MIRPRISIDGRNRDKFVGVTRAQARVKARKELQIVGEGWVAEVREIVRVELPRRDGVRHKKNTTHLDESFTYRIVEGPDQGFPMKLELTTKPGVSAAKVAALNFGRPGEHVIRARNAPHLRWGNAPGDLRKPFQKEVTWHAHGTEAKEETRSGYKFMERALQAVLRGRVGSRLRR